MIPKNKDDDGRRLTGLLGCKKCWKVCPWNNDVVSRAARDRLSQTFYGCNGGSTNDGLLGSTKRPVPRVR